MNATERTERDIEMMVIGLLIFLIIFSLSFSGIWLFLSWLRFLPEGNVYSDFYDLKTWAGQFIPFDLDPFPEWHPHAEIWMRWFMSWVYAVGFCSATVAVFVAFHFTKLLNGTAKKTNGRYIKR